MPAAVHFHKIHDACLGHFAQPAHVFVKAVDGAEFLANLRSGDKGALALDAVDVSFLRQLLQSLPHGGAAYFVGFTQFPLGGQQASLGVGAVFDLIYEAVCQPQIEMTGLFRHN